MPDIVGVFYRDDIQEGGVFQPTGSTVGSPASYAGIVPRGVV